jgi:hypothetical protein
MGKIGIPGIAHEDTWEAERPQDVTLRIEGENLWRLRTLISYEAL